MAEVKSNSHLNNIVQMNVTYSATLDESTRKSWLIQILIFVFLYGLRKVISTLCPSSPTSVSNAAQGALVSKSQCCAWSTEQLLVPNGKWCAWRGRHQNI